MAPDTRTKTEDCMHLVVRQAARHVTQSCDGSWHLRGCARPAW
jgi:hypothetical protein